MSKISESKSKKVNPRLAKFLCPNCDRCITINNYKRHRKSSICKEADQLGIAELKKLNELRDKTIELLDDIRSTKIFTEEDDDDWYSSYCITFDNLVYLKLESGHPSSPKA